MADGTSTNNYHVLTEVVGLIEIDNHVTVDLIDVIDVSEDGLAHHVLSEDVIVDVLHQSLHVIVIGRLQFLPDGVLLHLEVIVIIVGVADHVSEDLN